MKFSQQREKIEDVKRDDFNSSVEWNYNFSCEIGTITRTMYHEGHALPFSEVTWLQCEGLGQEDSQECRTMLWRKPSYHAIKKVL